MDNLEQLLGITGEVSVINNNKTKILTLIIIITSIV